MNEQTSQNYSNIITTHLATYFELSEEHIEVMLPAFIETLQEHMVNMNDISRCGDVQLFRKMGHTLKGALLNLGLNELAEYALAIELCDDAEMAHCRQLVDILNREIRKINQLNVL